MYYYPLSSLRAATICGAAPWAAAGLSGRPVRAPGFAKVASMPAWEAGAAQGAAPRACSRRDGAHGLVQALRHLRLAAMRGRLQPAAGFSPPVPKRFDCAASQPMAGAELARV